MVNCLIIATFMQFMYDFSCMSVLSLERLELIHYAISDTLADSLPLIGQLNHLCVWPDSVNQVISITMIYCRLL